MSVLNVLNKLNQKLVLLAFSNFVESFDSTHNSSLSCSLFVTISTVEGEKGTAEPEKGDDGSDLNSQLPCSVDACLDCPPAEEVALELDAV